MVDTGIAMSSIMATGSITNSCKSLISSYFKID